MVVGVTSLIGAIAAYRAGNVLLGRGVAFGLVAIGGAVAGAKASAQVTDAVLLAAFALLMLLVGGLMTVRQVRGRRRKDSELAADPEVGHPGTLITLDDPIVTLRPEFMCRCPQAVKVLVTATAVGLLTGFLGV